MTTPGSRPWSILSVTDLHYESPDTNFLDDAKELGDLPAFRDSIFLEFDAVLKGFDIGSLDLAVVGGDITTHGKSDGFRRFAAEALPILLRLTPTTEALCVVPGNHDVKWGLDPRGPDVFAKKFEAFSKMIAGYGVTSCLMPEDESTEDAQDHLSFKRPRSGPLYVNRDRKLIVACLNSAIRCGELNPSMLDDLGMAADQIRADLRRAGLAGELQSLDGLGERMRKYAIRDVAHVTRPQQQLIANELTQLKAELGDDWSSYLRIGVLHHHLIQFRNQIIEHRGYELPVDAGQILSMLAEFDFDLVLTGHKHQPYTEEYVSGDRKLLIVGGPTVGGYSVGDSFRGARLIEVEDGSDSRTISVADVSYTVGRGDVRRGLEECRRNAPRFVMRRPEGGLAQRIKAAGFSYRDVSSMTLINLDGDARRIVECEDLKVLDRRSGRALQHPISLPPTSGYLSNLVARGKGFSIAVDPPLKGDTRPQAYDATLAFDREIGTVTTSSYAYQWYAVNAFALDQQQFALKYGHPSRAENIEFTHFFVKDPVQELTVVVQFPPGYYLRNPPALRIARAIPGQTDGRAWEIDVVTEAHLAARHALRFYDALNIAALRVSQPSPDISYGIQWEVPESSSLLDSRAPIIADFLAGWSEGRFGPDGTAALLDMLTTLLRAMRLGFMPEWNGPMDGSLMYFEEGSALPLVVLVAALEQKAAKKEAAVQYQYVELPYQARLKYGDGIAGRAFKSNRLRIYVAPDTAGKADQPDYYTVIPGIPAHKILLSMPVSLPEDDADFGRAPRLYEAKRPYAVLNFGSVRRDCPLAGLRVPEHIPALLKFQHKANLSIFQAVTEIKEHFER